MESLQTQIELAKESSASVLRAKDDELEKTRQLLVEKDRVIESQIEDLRHKEQSLQELQSSLDNERLEREEAQRRGLHRFSSLDAKTTPKPPLFLKKPSQKSVALDQVDESYDTDDDLSRIDIDLEKLEEQINFGRDIGDLAKSCKSVQALDAPEILQTHHRRLVLALRFLLVDKTFEEVLTDQYVPEGAFPLYRKDYLNVKEFLHSRETDSWVRKGMYRREQESSCKRPVLSSEEMESFKERDANWKNLDQRFHAVWQMLCNEDVVRAHASPMHFVVYETERDAYMGLFGHLSTQSAADSSIDRTLRTIHYLRQMEDGKGFFVSSTFDQGGFLHKVDSLLAALLFRNTKAMFASLKITRTLMSHQERITAALTTSMRGQSKKSQGDAVSQNQSTTALKKRAAGTPRHVEEVSSKLEAHRNEKDHQHRELLAHVTDYDKALVDKKIKKPGDAPPPSMGWAICFCVLMALMTAACTVVLWRYMKASYETTFSTNLESFLGQIAERYGEFVGDYLGIPLYQARLALADRMSEIGTAAQAGASLAHVSSLLQLFAEENKMETRLADTQNMYGALGIKRTAATTVYNDSDVSFELLGRNSSSCFLLSAGTPLTSCPRGDFKPTWSDSAWYGKIMAQNAESYLPVSGLLSDFSDQGGAYYTGIKIPGWGQQPDLAFATFVNLLQLSLELPPADDDVYGAVTLLLFVDDSLPGRQEVQLVAQSYPRGSVPDRLSANSKFPRPFLDFDAPELLKSPEMKQGVVTAITRAGLNDRSYSSYLRSADGKLHVQIRSVDIDDAGARALASRLFILTYLSEDNPSFEVCVEKTQDIENLSILAVVFACLLSIALAVLGIVILHDRLVMQEKGNKRAQKRLGLQYNKGGGGLELSGRESVDSSGDDEDPLAHSNHSSRLGFATTLRDTKNPQGVIARKERERQRLNTKWNIERFASRVIKVLIAVCIVVQWMLWATHADELLMDMGKKSVTINGRRIQEHTEYVLRLPPFTDRLLMRFYELHYGPGAIIADADASVPPFERVLCPTSPDEQGPEQANAVEVYMNHLLDAFHFKGHYYVPRVTLAMEEERDHGFALLTAFVVNSTAAGNGWRSSTIHMVRYGGDHMESTVDASTVAGEPVGHYGRYCQAVIVKAQDDLVTADTLLDYTLNTATNLQLADDTRQHMAWFTTLEHRRKEQENPCKQPFWTYIKVDVDNSGGDDIDAVWCQQPEQLLQNPPPGSSPSAPRTIASVASSFNNALLNGYIERIDHEQYFYLPPDGVPLGNIFSVAAPIQHEFYYGDPASDKHRRVMSDYQTVVRHRNFAYFEYLLTDDDHAALGGRQELPLTKAERNRHNTGSTLDFLKSGLYAVTQTFLSGEGPHRITVKSGDAAKIESALAQKESDDFQSTMDGIRVVLPIENPYGLTWLVNGYCDSGPILGAHSWRSRIYLTMAIGFVFFCLYFAGVAFEAFHPEYMRSALSSSSQTQIGSKAVNDLAELGEWVLKIHSDVMTASVNLYLEDRGEGHDAAAREKVFKHQDYKPTETRSFEKFCFDQAVSHVQNSEQRRNVLMLCKLTNESHSPMALVFYNISTSLLWNCFLNAMIFVHLLLIFFEPPSVADLAPGSPYEPNIFAVNTLYWLCWLTECCQLVLNVMILHVWRGQNELVSVRQPIYDGLLGLVLFVMCLDGIIVHTGNYVNLEFMVPLRPVVVILVNRSIRSSVFMFISSLWSARDIFFVYSLVVLCAAVMGVTLFGSAHGFPAEADMWGDPLAVNYGREMDGGVYPAYEVFYKGHG